MRDLALFLFRKGLTQLVMTDLSLETQTEVAASVLGREAFEDLLAFNEQIESSSVAYNAWQSRVSCLVIC